MTSAPTIVDRDTTIELLASTWAALIDLADSLDPAEFDRPSCLAGWTVKDQLSHVLATELMLLGEETPVVGRTDWPHVRNDIGRVNETWVESMRADSPDSIIERLRDATARRLDALRAMTQAEFDESSWTPAGPNQTYGRFMRIRHYDSYMHETDIRDAVGAPLREDVATIEFCLSEPAGALGYIVAKRAGVPQGSVVDIELVGAAAHHWWIDVADRARVSETDDGRGSDAGISLDASMFLRLTGGRISGRTWRSRTVELRGDEGLAGQLVDNLAFTI